MQVWTLDLNAIQKNVLCTVYSNGHNLLLCTAVLDFHSKCQQKCRTKIQFVYNKHLQG